MVPANYIQNYPVTESAIKNAHLIFGPDLAGIRGRMVCMWPESMRTDLIQIPCVFIKWHWLVTLMADVMFVKINPFLVSLTRELILLNADLFPTQTAKSLAPRIDQAKHLYAKAK